MTMRAVSREFGRVTPRCLARAFLVGVALFATAQVAHAEARISGRPEKVRIEANEDTVAGILAALGNSFDLTYRSSAPLDRKVSGVYEGPLRRVLARLLEGYNFFIEPASGRTKLVVLGPGGNIAAMPSIPGPVAVPAAVAAPPAIAPTTPRQRPPRRQR
jgi:hypothetical protein